MSTELLDHLKQQSASLTTQEKLQLAAYLAGQASSNNSLQVDEPPTSERVRRQRMTWLRENRERYAGRYVALDGDTLVGEGNTFREAREQALSRGINNSFVVRVTSEDEVLFGGW